MADRRARGDVKPYLNIALLVIGCLGVAATLYGTREFVNSDRQPPGSTPENSQYYLTQPVTYKFDKKGQRVYKLIAKRSLYFQSGVIQIQQPNMRYAGAKKGQWHLTAKRGFVPAAHQRIRLNDQVEVVKHQADGGKTHIKTDQAWVNPDQHLVTSSHYVRADLPTHRLTGMGMRLNTQTDHLKVKNDANVTYQQ
ncbi:LPS export ABC transporter periplasmic protein LptC [Salinisphaera orenii]|uniref:LPS export ABC transporter periplasmic protein LptC n=1 Tax=Salinisphaera orenii TaxID=856731 RepID=UPI000DBE2979